MRGCQTCLGTGRRVEPTDDRRRLPHGRDRFRVRGVVVAYLAETTITVKNVTIYALLPTIIFTRGYAPQKTEAEVRDIMGMSMPAPPPSKDANGEKR